ncbi:TlpA disulfide reductase family protein [Flavobacterium sp. LC2016-12]|uniref:TlpA disulfide reductase family protein n=1 Tax=Flavobacterium sp. LC2016-12 TaxID=2783794 RepID=UPI001889EB3E|nr:TlpA disulfide reductase family protein [Flavobacterium sp. LC2016-12]MBF4463733.1 AhpC/TSA family protein [Flavobacterium sp. LC2016-12]
MASKFILSILFLVSCIIYSQNKTISGKISGFKNGDKVLLSDPELNQFIDSTIILNDRFVMKSRLSDEPKSLYLVLKSEGKFYSTQLFIANENVAINGNKKDFPYDLVISGSEHQNKLTILKNQTKVYQKERDTIVTFLRKETTDTSSTHKTLYKKNVDRMHTIDKITDSITKIYIKSNLNSFAGIKELFNLRSTYQKIELENSYNSLPSNYKESVYGKRLFNYLKIGDQLKTGDFFFDFEAKDQFGKKHKLSEFTGNYILLDFTETYCEFCIRSKKELKEISESNYKNLKIVSFNADKSELTWKKGLERDKISWLSLSDGEGTTGNTLLKYGVTGYPTFFLIDPNGKIVYSTFGYDDQKIKNMIKDKMK